MVRFVGQCTEKSWEGSSITQGLERLALGAEPGADSASLLTQLLSQNLFNKVLQYVLKIGEDWCRVLWGLGGVWQLQQLAAPGCAAGGVCVVTCVLGVRVTVCWVWVCAGGCC